MKKVVLSDVEAYDAPGHFNVKTLRLHGKAETGAQQFWIGMSHFLPGGGADFGSPPGEKAYFILEGEVTVKNRTEEFVLKKNDLIYIEPNEERAIVNHTNLPTTMLVIYSYN